MMRKDRSRGSLASVLWAASVLLLVAPVPAGAADLIAHWPLAEDARDRSGGMHGAVHGGVAFARVADRPAADFNGRDGYLEVADGPALPLGRADFSIALWINPRRPLTGIPGDLVSKWDAPQRRGINLYLSGGSSAYSSVCDSRHVHFCIDDAYAGPERDHGKPWDSNSLISNLVVFQGRLYAGIADAAEPRYAALVFRLTGGQTWEDCGRIGGDDPTMPSVQSMIVHDGRLYTGTGRWDWVIAKGKFKDNPPPPLDASLRLRRRQEMARPGGSWQGFARAVPRELQRDVVCRDRQCRGRPSLSPGRRTLGGLRRTGRTQPRKHDALGRRAICSDSWQHLPLWGRREIHPRRP
jgi:hypothetical protein